MRKLVVFSFLVYLATVFYVLLVQFINAQAGIANSIPSATTSFNSQLFYIGIIAAVMVVESIVLIKLRRNLAKALKIYMMIYFFAGGFVLIFLPISLFLPNNLISLIGLSLISGGFPILIVSRYLSGDRRFFNFIGGTIAVFGGFAFALAFSPLVIGIFFIFLSIYDYIAVFRSKHMTNLVKMLMGNEPLPAMLVEGNLDDMQKKINTLQQEPKTEIADEKVRTASAVGLGDLILPAGLIGAIAYNMPSPYWIAALIGAVAGMGLNAWYAKIRKSAIPAIPLIFAGILCGISLVFLFA